MLGSQRPGWRWTILAQSLVPCVSLWIDGRLGPVERACLLSVQRQGHSIALYSYAPPDGLPDGIEARDGAEILPLELLDSRCGGRPAIFSDWFRYELLRRNLGTWVDTDIYLLAPLDGERPYLFGEEKPGTINNAVLRLPSPSPLLADLLRVFEDGRMPYASFAGRLSSGVRSLFNRQIDVGRMAWGSTGPSALTAGARYRGLSEEALPQRIFYPVKWQDAGWIVEPRLPVEDMISSDTVSVHLWNECIKDFKNDPAPRGSFLERLQREGAA